MDFLSICNVVRGLADDHEIDELDDEYLPMR